jgi:hypothetical protein
MPTTHLAFPADVAPPAEGVGSFPVLQAEVTARAVATATPSAARLRSRDVFVMGWCLLFDFGNRLPRCAVIYIPDGTLHIAIA